MPNFIFHPLFGNRWVPMGLFLLLLGAFWFFQPEKERLSVARRRVIFVLRCVVFLVFALLLFRPSVVFERSEKLSSSLLFLIDRSESMTVRDQPEGKSRYEALVERLGALRSELERFELSASVEAFTFDESVAPVEIQKGQILLASDADGQQTAIGASLLDLLARSSGQRLLGLILLSDGSQRSAPPNDELPQDAAFRFRDFGVPLYTVCFGQTGNIASRRDVAVTELTAADRIFAKNEMIVSGQVRATACAGRTIPIELRFESPDGTMVSAARTEVAVESDDEVVPFKFFYTPEESGQWKITVAAAEQDGEILTSNNTRSGFVDVVEGGLAALVLEGTLRFEQKFVRLATESAAEIQTDYERLAPNTNLAVAEKTLPERIALETASRPSMAETLFQPGRYAVYLLGDLDATAFKEEELTALAESVRQGAGLVLLAGERAFSAGGWASTPLADLFPMELSDHYRLPLNLSLEMYDRRLTEGEKLRLTRPFRAVPTEQGGAHYLTQLSVDRNKSLDLWRQLPPLEPVYHIGPIKPSAQVLAMGMDENGRSEPILVVGRYGRGRVAVLATDSTWRWSMAGFAETHHRFWRQLVLWAANREQLREGELLVEMDKTRFAPNEPAEFRLRYRPESGGASDTWNASAVVVGPDGTECSVDLTAVADAVTPTFTGVFRQAALVGDYWLRASIRSARNSAAASKEGGARFLVESRNPELDNPAASPALMANIAELTGGRAVLPEELPALLDELSQKKETLISTRQISRTLYDTWPVFILFTLLLSIEWYLRKRWGMV